MSVFGYGLEPYGYGPYGGLGGVSLPATVPPLGGYGGYSYGTSPYGSLGSFGKPSIAITGGYGGCAYGTSPYGCIDSLGAPPEVIAAISITGFIIEVFFSQEMSPDADLFDPTSYTLIDITGAAPAIVLSVEEGVPGAWGPTSVILNHTGTTLGGLYTVVVVAGSPGFSGCLFLHTVAVMVLGLASCRTRRWRRSVGAGGRSWTTRSTVPGPVRFHRGCVPCGRRRCRA